MVRYAVSAAGWAANFSSAFTSAEPLAYLARWTGAIWNTFLNQALLAGRRISVSDKLAVSIASAAWHIRKRHVLPAKV